MKLTIQLALDNAEFMSDAACLDTYTVMPLAVAAILHTLADRLGKQHYLAAGLCIAVRDTNGNFIGQLVVTHTHPSTHLEYKA